jgi:hypothetical protein
MRDLAIGLALTIVLLLVPGGHFLLVLLLPLAFLSLLMFRASWQPVPTTYRPEATRRPTGPESRLRPASMRCAGSVMRSRSPMPTFT